MWLLAASSRRSRADSGRSRRRRGGSSRRRSATASSTGRRATSRSGPATSITFYRRGDGVPCLSMLSPEEWGGSPPHAFEELVPPRGRHVVDAVRRGRGARRGEGRRARAAHRPRRLTAALAHPPSWSSTFPNDALLATRKYAPRRHRRSGRPGPRPVPHGAAREPRGEVPLEHLRRRDLLLERARAEHGADELDALPKELRAGRAPWTRRPSVRRARSGPWTRTP